MSPEFAALLGVVLVAFMLGAPVGHAMLSGGIVYMFLTGGDLGNVAQVVMGSFYSKFVLLAIPLFIFTAEIMNSSGVADRLFRFAYSLVGGLRGGLGQVDIVTSVIFSGMSGSAMADASGTGKMIIKAQTDAGYRPSFACATSVSSATLGGVIPPSITMVIYGYLSGTSVGMLFAGGILPGFLIAGAMMLWVGIAARLGNFPKPGWEGFGYVVTSFLAALPAMLTVVILLGGIYSGWFTPTEAAAVAGFYSLGLGACYGLRSPRSFYRVLRTSCTQTASVCIVLAGGFMVSYAVASEGIGREVGEWLLGLSSSALVLLLTVNALFLLMGMFIDTLVILLVMVPVILPTLVAVGVDPVHLGVVLTFNIMIGLASPPFGMLLFIVSNITGVSLRAIIKDMWPFLGVLIGSLLVLSVWPDIILLVPRWLGYAG